MENVVKKLLYSMFSKNAILAAAIYEQLDDIRYCTEHHMLPSTKKWEAQCNKADKLLRNDKTFNRESMKKFREEVNKYISTTKHKDKYKGLNEIEHFAVRKLYYYDNY